MRRIKPGSVMRRGRRACRAATRETGPLGRPDRRLGWRRRLARELQHVTASPRSAGEKGRIEKSWSEVYKLTEAVPVPISDAAMLRYGVSATPTFVFVDRKGVVRRYSPTRMSEDRLSAEIEKLLR